MEAQRGPSCPAGLFTHRSWGGGAIGVPSCLWVFEGLRALPSLDLELEAMRPAQCLCCVGSGQPGIAACRLGKEPAAWRQIPRSRSPLGTEVLAGGRSQPEGAHGWSTRLPGEVTQAVLSTGSEKGALEEGGSPAIHRSFALQILPVLPHCNGGVCHLGPDHWVLCPCPVAMSP